MKRIMIVLLICFQMVLLATTAKQTAVQCLKTMPLAFTENAGQTDESIRFTSRTFGADFAFTSNGVDVLLSRSKADPGIDQFKPGEPGSIEAFKFQLNFIGANANPDIKGEERLPHPSNYFIGNDPSRWRTNVPNYKQIRFGNLYKDIDLVYYGNKSSLKYDFIVRPKADYNAIQIQYEGIQSLRIDPEGSLIVTTPFGEIREEPPVVYQNIDGEKVEVSAAYHLLDETTFSFRIGHYDPSHALVIDPDLTYSTYLGGNNGYTDSIQDIDVDQYGNMVVTGSTSSTTDFPMVPTGYQQSFQGGTSDAFVVIIDKTGTGLVSSTFLGSDGSDRGKSIRIDSSGDVYVAVDVFYTTNFPTTLSPQGTGIHIVKLLNGGEDLIYSRFICYGSVEDIEIDETGAVYAVGTGYDDSTPSFPISSWAYDTVWEDWEVVVFKLDVNGDVECATLLGGTYKDMGYGIAVAQDKTVYIVGDTRSHDFQVATNSYDDSFNSGSGIEDVFISHLNQDFSDLLHGTFLGSGAMDWGRDIYIGPLGYIYLTGFTENVDFPVTNLAYDNSLGGSGDAFVTKMFPDLSDLIYSTFLGGSEFDGGNAIVVDIYERVIVTGWTTSDDFPCSDDAFDDTKNGGSEGGLWNNDDIFVTMFDVRAENILYSTYVGGSLDEGPSSMTIDSDHVIHIAGSTHSLDFPITPIHYDDSMDNSSTNGIILRFGNLGSQIIGLAVQSPSPDDTWYGGDKVAIQWLSEEGLSDQIKVELYQGGEFKQVISFETANDGYMTWDVSYFLETGDDYQIKLIALDDPSISQISQMFSIVAGLIPDRATATISRVEPIHIPVLDGDLSDAIWQQVEPETLLTGGNVGDYNVDWTDWNDNLVSWKAIWCEETNRVYVGVQVQDDIQGAFDNGPDDDPYEPSSDEMIEFYVDADQSGGEYWQQFDTAQLWRVNGENHRDLFSYPDMASYPQEYTGDDFQTAVTQGENGNWSCEAVFDLYNTYSTDLKDLTENDVIGWDVWYDDSDNETENGGYFTIDHQTGWNYTDKAWRNADHFGAMILGSLLEYQSIAAYLPRNYEAGFYPERVFYIRWSGTLGVGSYVKIDLYNGEVFDHTIVESTVNDGDFNWLIESDQAAGDNYYIKVSSVSDPSISDFTDPAFSILELPKLSILLPNVDEILWEKGDQVDITWTSTGNVGDWVSISLVKSGLSSNSISDSTENDGLFSWTIPESIPEDSHYALRLSSLSDRSITAQSDSLIQIQGSTGVDMKTIPFSHALHRNFPNPFNPVTTIPFDVAKKHDVRLTIYNVQGEQIKTLVNSSMTPGSYKTVWHGDNYRGEKVSSGIYLVKLNIGSWSHQQKIMLLR
ncbi:Ser-Thr-rich GPI-anchored membrane family protein [bacterium]